MAKKQIEELIVSEHVLEIRYEASGSFLDVRGLLADYIKDQKQFPHWRIEANVINFHDSDKGVDKIGAFAGYKNAGYVAYNPDTKNFFQDKATSYWKCLTDNPHFKIPKLLRVGIRTKVFLPSEKDFESINNTIYSTFFTPKTSEILSAQETDLQIILNLNDGDFKCRVVIGPIHKDETGQYFSFDSEHFKSAGTFIDIDYFKDANLAQDSVPSLLRKAMELTWAKLERLEAAIGL
jgi:hypothetical protein